MKVVERLLEIAVNHELIKKTEIGLFRGYVERSPEEIRSTEDKILHEKSDIQHEKRIVNRMKDYKVPLEILQEIRKVLKEVLGEVLFQDAITNGEKTIPFHEIPLPEDPIQKETRKGEIRKYFEQEDLSRIKFDIYNERTKSEVVLIPAEFFMALPTRENDFLSIYFRNFGTPPEVELRRKGLYKGKKTWAEIQYEFRTLLYSEIVPVIDRGIQEKCLETKEHIFLKKFIYKLQDVLRLYQGIKKGHIDLENDEQLMPSDTYIYSNKVIKNAVKFQQLLGIEKERAELIDPTLKKNKVQIKCAGCPTLFIPRDKNHKYCGKCPESKNRVKRWREEKHQPNKPKPEEKIINLTTFSLKELLADKKGS